MRWKVERAGTKGHYSSGWFARNEWLESGAWFPTHRQALAFADAQARKNLRVQMPRILAQWGVSA